MRSLLIVGLFITACASANAATVHHHRTRHVIRPCVASSFADIPSFAFAPPPPLIDSATGLALTN
jgi:hypothetical protein